VPNKAKTDGLTLEHLFHYNSSHVYLAQDSVRDRLASHIRPS
jgi:hypothetical protein